jgi:FkbM family methyltransferase
VSVNSSADWEIYNEVLVNGEYDQAITYALERSCSDEINVLDLGANVGYFVFRCADLFLRNPANGKQWSIMAIEGAPQTFADLSQRVMSAELLRDHVRLVHGLVGERNGLARISDSATHYGNSISTKAVLGTVEVNYIDVVKATDHCKAIDLLKCDIEGAEFNFLKNYPDLLVKTTTAVFEFHKYGDDIDEYRRLLYSYGFRRKSVLREAPLFSIELFER